MDMTPASQIEDALRAMYNLLVAVKENLWADSVKGLLKAWLDERKFNEDIFSSGGMGSFNDLILCAENNHKVNEDDVDLVNHLLGLLKNLCIVLARAPDKSFTASEIQLMVNKLRGPKSEAIIGMRCASCNYIQTTLGAVKGTIFDLELSQDLFQSLEDGLLATTTNQILVAKEKIPATLLNEFLSALKTAQIHIVGNTNYKCPNCKTNLGFYEIEMTSRNPIRL